MYTFTYVPRSIYVTLVSSITIRSSVFQSAISNEAQAKIVGQILKFPFVFC